MSGNVAARINQLALIASVALFVAIGLLWWSDRTRPRVEPGWNQSRFAMISPAAALKGRALLVAVHPGCSHCAERLAELAREGVADSLSASLGMLVIDQPERPAAPSRAAELGAGVWWDSSGVWRKEWGRRVYGEAFLFAPDGKLERVLPTNGDWRGAAPR